MHPNPPTAVGERLKRKCVVEVLRVVGINGACGYLAQV
jgi:hypothetical protein